MTDESDILKTAQDKFIASQVLDLTGIISQVKTEFYRSSQGTAFPCEQPEAVSLNDHIKAIRDYMESWKEGAEKEIIQNSGFNVAVGKQIKTASSSVYVKGYYRKNGKYIRPHLRARVNKQKKRAVS